MVKNLKEDKGLQKLIQHLSDHGMGDGLERVLSMADQIEKMELVLEKLMAELETINNQLGNYTDVRQKPLNEKLTDVAAILIVKCRELENKLTEIKEAFLAAVEKTLQNIKEHGIKSLDEMKDFLKIEEGLREMANDLKEAVDSIDRGIAIIDRFGERMKESGNHFKNAVRVLTEKEAEAVKDKPFAAAEILKKPWVGAKNLLAALEGEIEAAITLIKNPDVINEKEFDAVKMDGNMDMTEFNKEQMREIRIGVEKGLDVDLYAKPGLRVMQMYYIRRGLEKGLDVDIYAKPEFHEDQMCEIREGLEKGLDVNIYARPEFDPGQMCEIREGLEKGLDVNIYARPEFDDGQMYQVRRGLEKGLDVSNYAKTELGADQMGEIERGLEQGLDVDVYAKPEFDADQMCEIREGLGQGLDVSVYARPGLEAGRMNYTRRVMKLEKLEANMGQCKLDNMQLDVVMNSEDWEMEM